MNPGHFSRLFEMSYATMFRNLEGITHDESLVTPPTGGNCLNWVLGHIVATRNRMLPMLRLSAIWPPEHAFFYSGRDEAQWTPGGAFHLDALKADLARSQQLLNGAFDTLAPNDLVELTDNGQPLSDVIGFFHFHESYHGGQIALLRRVLGHEGVIKPSASRRPSGALRLSGS